MKHMKALGQLIDLQATSQLEPFVSLALDVNHFSVSLWLH